MKRKTEDKYFEQFIDIIEDDYWREHFKEFAQGNFPKGFKYENEVLIYRYGRANYQIKLSSDPYEAIQEIIDFCCKHGKFKSPETPETKPVERPLNNSWKKASKQAKLILINAYVKLLSEKYALKRGITEDLLLNLTLASQQNLIKEEHVHMENGGIENLTLIKITREGISLELKFTPTKKAKPKPKENNLYLQTMVKMLEQHRKISKRKVRETTMTTVQSN